MYIKLETVVSLFNLILIEGFYKNEINARKDNIDIRVHI